MSAVSEPSVTLNIVLVFRSSSNFCFEMNTLTTVKLANELNLITKTYIDTYIVCILLKVNLIKRNFEFCVNYQPTKLPKLVIDIRTSDDSKARDFFSILIGSKTRAKFVLARARA